MSTSSGISWANDVSGDFDIGMNWVGGVAPGPADNAILGPVGSTAYTVTASTGESVNSIQLDATATLAITANTFTATGGTGSGGNAGAILVGESAQFSVTGPLYNTGAITIDAGAGIAAMNVNSATVTLTGGGTITLKGASAYLESSGATGTLTNVDNTISGNGVVGYNGLSLVNQAQGVIDADVAGVGAFGSGMFVGVTANAGLIETTGAGSMLLDANADNSGAIKSMGSGLLQIHECTLANSGVIEAAGAGGLELFIVTIDGSGGGVVVADAGSHINLVSGADFVGGTLKSAGSGQIRAVSGVSELDGTTSTVTNQAVVSIVHGAQLLLQGAIDNIRQIKLGGIAGTKGKDYSDLYIGSAGATLTGHGHVTLSDSPNNVIVGSGGSFTLTNVDNTIAGAGFLGSGEMTLVNDAKGVIDATGANTLVVDTGSIAINNFGLIEAAGAGGCLIESAVNNSGTLEAKGGTLTLNGTVSGAGKTLIAAGRLDIVTAASHENVRFTGSTGVLELDNSQTYKGAVTAFGSTSGTSLDLRDITYDGTTTTSYSGSASGGTLTVTHGGEVAGIVLIGDYLSATFTPATDNAGGTSITSSPAGVASAPHHFIAAMAGLGIGAPGSVHAVADVWRAAASMLAMPRLGLA